MWITQPITTRLFVWLAVIAIPFQGLPAAACGCPDGATLSHKTNSSHETSELPSCCEQESDCCSAGVSSDSGCQCGTDCQCGISCQCGENSTPTKPATPPVESSSPERILADSASAAFFVAVYLPSTTGQHSNGSVGANALTSRDCCISLCRFTLWAVSSSTRAHHEFCASCLHCLLPKIRRYRRR